MTTMTKRLVAIAATLCFTAGLAACSSDDEESGSADTEESGSGADQVPSAENETWCQSVQNLVDQSGGGDLSVSGNLASLSQAFTSLAANAPDEVVDEMQTLSEVSNAAVQAQASTPTSTIPQADADRAVEAWDTADTWVQENCGVDLPTLTA